MMRMTLAILVLGACAILGRALGQEAGGEMHAAVPAHTGLSGGAQEGAVLRLLDRPAMMQEIGMSEEDAAALKKKMYPLEQERIKAKAELDLAALEQARLVTDESASESALMTAVEKAGKLRTALAKLQMKELLMVRSSLTAEQRAKLRALIEKRMETWRENAGRRPQERDRRDRREREQRGVDQQPPARPESKPH